MEIELVGYICRAKPSRSNFDACLRGLACGALQDFAIGVDADDFDAQCSLPYHHGERAGSTDDMRDNVALFRSNLLQEQSTPAPFARREGDCEIVQGRQRPVAESRRES